MSGTDYTTTPNLGLFKPIANMAVGMWGDLWNSNADAIDSAIHFATGGGPFLPMAGGSTSPMAGHIFMGNHSLLDVAGINSYGNAPLPFANAIQTAGYQFWPPAGTITFGGAGQPFIDVNANYAGTLTGTGILAANRIICSADTVAAPLNNSFTWLSLVGNVGGGSTPPTGDRSGLYVHLTAASTAGDVAAGRTGGPAYVAVSGMAQSAVNQGGTNLTNAAAGGLFGANFLVSLGSGATNFGQIVGAEIDVAATAGSSLKGKMGLQIVQTTADQVAATNGDEIAILIANQAAQGTAPGWVTGLAFGSPNAAFPLRSTGTLIGAHTSTGSINAALGIDLSAVTFSGAAFKSTGFTIDGLGHTSPLLPNATTDAAAATAGVPIGALYRNGNAVQVRLT